MANLRLGGRGVTLTKVLLEIYLKPTAVQSNFSRTYAQQIAALASLGLVSTRTSRQEFGRQWRVTSDGYDLLKEDCLL